MPGSIDIVIVNYNGEQWLTRCLLSLAADVARCESNVSITIVDNASTDGSIQLIRSLLLDVAILELDHNIGFGNASNLGVAEGTSSYILLLNNDVVVPPGMLNQLVMELELNQYDAIAAREAPYEGGETGNYRSTLDCFGYPVFIRANERSKRSIYLSAACVLIRRDVFESLGGFDPDFFMYFEDTDLFWRLLLQGGTFDYAAQAFVLHAGHGSSGGIGWSELRFVWRNENQLRALVKNSSTTYLLMVVPLFIVLQFLEFLILFLFKPRIALTYPRGMWAFLSSIRSTLDKRKHVQAKRTVSTWAIYKLMYHGNGKLVALARSMGILRG